MGELWECEVHNDLQLTLCCLFSVCTLHPDTDARLTSAPLTDAPTHSRWLKTERLRKHVTSLNGCENIASGYDPLLNMSRRASVRAAGRSSDLVEGLNMPQHVGAWIRGSGCSAAVECPVLNAELSQGTSEWDEPRPPKRTLKSCKVGHT